MDVKASVQLQPVTNIPEDVVVNTFTFTGVDDAAPALGLGAIATALVEFYTVNPDPSITIAPSSLLSSFISRAANSAIIELYNIGAGGSPVFTFPFTPRPPHDTKDLPNEMAACLSFHADLTGIPEVEGAGAPGPVGDRHPRAQRRGRVYIGPLNVGAVEDTGGLLALGARNALKWAGRNLRDRAALTNLGIDWTVTSNAGGVRVRRPVVGGWVDNAPDVQRRRGRAATVRDVF